MSSTPLTEDQAAFIAGGVSITLAARDMRRVPSLVKVLGCRVSADRRAVTVLVDAAAARQVLQDIAATGAIAVVYSRPSTHHTLQIKGSDARQVVPAATDHELVAAHNSAFAADLVPLGYSREFSFAIHGLGDELAAVQFTVDAVFAQTPGPGAGARIGGGA